MRDGFTLTKTSELSSRAKEQLLALWNTEYPEKLAYTQEGFEGYLQALSNATHWLLADEQGMLCGWTFSFDREQERWFAILLAEAAQGQGLGRVMLDALKQTESTLNGWVIDHGNDRRRNGQPYRSPMGFYKKCGFTVLHGTRLELEKLSAVKISWTAA